MIRGVEERCCAGLASNAYRPVADAMRQYRRLFDEWTGGVYLSAVRAFVEAMCADLGHPEIEWKPPGAGGMESLIVVVSEAASADAVLSYLTGHDWWARRAAVVGRGCDQRT